MYSPPRVPVEQLNEQKGTIEFTVSKSNLFEESIPLIRILEIAKGQTVFILERDPSFNLRFIQSNPNYKTKIAEINIRDFHNAPKLFIAFTWSEKENAIYVGDYREELRSAKSFEDPNIKFRVDKDRGIYQIGDKGIQVKYYRVKVGEEVVLEPTAKEIFDFQMEKVRILIENCKKGDFLFESTLVQQIIVMLTTAFEVYSRTRFIELEKEDKIVNMGALYNCFVPRRYREQLKEEVSEIVIKQRKTDLEVFIEGIDGRRHVNFQDWKSFKDAYNKGYGLKIGEIGIPNDISLDVQRFIRWRHEIIHSKDDQTMINFEEVPPAEPLFTNKDLAEEGLNAFQKFCNEFHKYTLRL
ncbi:MAG: hypothetical protein SVO01_12015 [Thermotogota bacterium]|nr:hypothetical protein [Thermotogota bacterium]